MKKILALVLALVMALALVACGDKGGEQQEGGTPNTTGEEKVVKIGVFEPLTGDNGAGGKQEVLGIQYANSVKPTVTIGGEEYKIELDIQDNQSSTDKAVSAAQQLVADKVSVVLGSYGSGVSIAAGTYFANAKIPAIGCSCTNAAVTAGNDYYFRVCFLDPFQGTVHANYAYKEMGATKAYTLAMLGSDYDQGLVYYFSEAFKALGGTVTSEDFPEGNANFVSYINNAMADGADVIFCPVSTNYAQLIIEAAAAQGFKGAILGTDTVDNNMVLESTKGKDVRLLVTTFYQEGGAPEFDTGVKEYINASSEALAANGGNDTISAVTAMGYDAYFVALEAMKKADSGDKAAIMAALPSVTYTGVSGSIAFDAQGDAIRDTAYIKAADTASGAWVLETVQTGSGS